MLNLYGDRGNILTLCSRLEWRSIPCVIEEITVGEHDKKLADYDLFFIGGGQDEQQKPVAKDLLLRSNELKDCIELGKPVLAVCGGYQLLGKSYQTSGAIDIAGLGILDIVTRAKQQKEGQRQDRLVGNVSAHLLIELKTSNELKTLVGFENHSGRTYILSGETKPLARVIRGFGNNAEDGFEGAVYKNVFATYLHGSLLPKNPHFADEIIYRSLEAARHEYLQENKNLAPLNDKLEILAHNFATKL